jgi:hypothetical protein
MIMDLQGASQQITQQSQQDSSRNRMQKTKKQEDALKGFQQALQELP